jgi:signal peptidase I
MKKVLKVIVNFLIYIAIVAVIVFGLPTFLSWSLKTSYPMAAITSGSMWPVLHEGDLVFIQGIDKDQLKVGDIIVYRNTANIGFTIHRIVKLEPNDLITRGDANFTDDAPVAYDNVVGRTFQVFGRNVRLPYLGFVTVYATRK